MVRKWLLLLVAGVVVASGAALVFSTLQPKTYEAKTALIVGQSLTSLSPDYTGLLTSQQLSTTYASIATTRPLLEAVITELGLDTTPDELLKRIATDTTPGSPLLVISAQDVQPETAAAIANALANRLIAETAILQGRENELQLSIDEDLAATRAQIKMTQDRVAELLAITQRDPAQDTELATLDGRLVSLRATYATLLSYASAGATNLITVVEPAEPPPDAISPRPLLNMLVAAVLGLFLAAGIAWLAEYMDESVGTPEEIEAVSGLGTIGTIGQIKATPGKGEFPEIATILHPRSAISEGYRTLRTNLEFTAVDHPVGSLLVASASPDEGKSVTASNIAIVYAQAGRSVLLVDADLRKPQLHHAFDLPNNVGLTTTLVTEVGIAAVAQATSQPNLSVLSTGPLPPNPAEMIGSQRMRAILEEAQAAFDLVVIDSPPLQAFADTAVLSSMVDCTVLVVDAERSRRRAVKQAREILARADATVAGVVLNRAAGSAYADYAQQYGAYLRGAVASAAPVAEARTQPSVAEPASLQEARPSHRTSEGRRPPAP
jgi:non-specific protein-tyrosine kinase